jgi:hypothetical protein
MSREQKRNREKNGSGCVTSGIVGKYHVIFVRVLHFENLQILKIVAAHFFHLVQISTAT